VNITKLDKKLSIIKVEVKSKDELFAKNFADKLVQTASNFYIETKTKRASENVRILQKQTDSIRVILDSSIGKVATAIEAAPNANPALVSLKVPSQKKQIDVQENSALYSELVKNLELSKMSLRHDTPIIQIIDKPVLPLKIDRVRKIKGILIGGILGILIALTVIITKKFYNDLMNS
jgi:uncharacterized protein involved in exopolysaccharide biosynthesis